MMKMKSHSGSALLIVLGMLAFMVMSSVGFAVYMRQSRVPSSHLRRESTSRYLLKSALANAIGRLNGVYYRDPNDNSIQGVEGIYDDPYPGVMPKSIIADLDNQSAADIRKNGDYWSKRVFMPFGEVDTTETVSTLTLEGLAYLPPAIINEARVYSRRTRTAKWEALSYDLGRYAFTAIDVSDCFDINKLAADDGGKAPRRTSNPSGRITIASLFPGKVGEELSMLLKQRMTEQTPYVSLADYNVALGNTKFTPFSRLLSTKKGEFYQAGDWQSLSNALFITDTWFPATNQYMTSELALETDTSASPKGTFFDLAMDENSKNPGQPYAKSFLRKDNKKFEEIPGTSKIKGSSLAAVLEDNLGIGIVGLVDYLDADYKPTSLALPTTEAVPMVTGIHLAGNVAPKFEKRSNVKEPVLWKIADDEGTLHTIERRVDQIDFKGLNANALQISGTVVYPFKRMKSEDRVENFEVEALVGVFYATDGLKSRLADRFHPTEEDWKNAKPRDGIYFMKSQKKAVKFDKDIAKMSDAVASFNMPLTSSSETMPFMYLINEKDKGPDQLKPGQGSVPIDVARLEQRVCTFDGMQSVDAAKRFVALNDDGNTADGFGTTGKDLLTAVQRQQGERQNEVEAKENFKPYVAVWVRVLVGGDTVDLVPASFSDDIALLKANKGLKTALNGVCGPNAPILDFKVDMSDDSKLLFDDTILTVCNGNKPLTFSGWQSLLCVDPRFNYAPEDWFGVQEKLTSKDMWLEKVEPILGVGGRDRDIFMFVSDQEHLQSIGELTFLPRLEPLGQKRLTRLGGDFAVVSRFHGRNDFDQRSPSSMQGFANGGFFWKTYSAYNRADLTYANPYYDLKLYEAGGSKRVTVVNGEDGFRVNPLSPDSRVVAAAIGDTPWDYYIASTNKDSNLVIKDIEANPANYSFGSIDKSKYKSQKNDWEPMDVADIAAALSKDIRSIASEDVAKNPYNVDWTGVYETMNWEDAALKGDEQLKFFDIELMKPLHGVDRKFLFSYWRDCFQNRQQLFLIFIRAEPLTVGGAGGESLSNSQLGARGVALVWRDPLPPPQKANGKNPTQRPRRENFNQGTKIPEPHRTRILFYHQFD